MKNRIVRFFTRNKGNRNPSIYHNLTFSQYELLEQGEKEQVDYLLEFVKPCTNIVNKNTNIGVKHEDIFLFSLGEIIDFKELVSKEAREIDILKTYTGSKFEGFSNIDFDVFHFTGMLKHFYQQFEILLKAEEVFKDEQDAGIWKAAGIEELEMLGSYVTIATLTDDILEEDKILEMPYSRIFARRLYTKKINEITNKFRELKSK